MSKEEITAFTWIDPEAIHLVGRAANGHDHALVAKSRTEKGPHMSSKKAAKRLAKAILAGADPSQAMAALSRPGASRRPDLAVALRLMKSAADEAGAAGDVERANGLRREIAELKLGAAEKAHQARGTMGRYGPGSRQLFTNVGTLPDDRTVGGI